jgi:hypothetical protein
MVATLAALSQINNYNEKYYLPFTVSCYANEMPDLASEGAVTKVRRLLSLTTSPLTTLVASTLKRWSEYAPFSKLPVLMYHIYWTLAGKTRAVPKITTLKVRSTHDWRDKWLVGHSDIISSWGTP